MNILSLLPVGEYRYKCPGEYAGPCPWCGGEDRFIIFAGQGVDGLGRFWCRQCDKGGDAIQFLREFKGMSYRAACEALQVEPRQDNATQTIKQATTSQHWKPEPERIPSEVWQRRALCFYFECQARLSTQAGQEALQFRGLNIDFARRHGLGWNPADQYDDPAAWGLEPWLNDKGNPGKVALPAGLVIFTKRKDRTVAVKIRRHNWQPDDNWPKYHAVRGGGNGAYVLGKRDLPVVLVESELDALLIAQETSELCSVVALPAGNRPDAQTAAFLRAAPDILYAGDFDEAGKKAFG
ncbi:MAG: zinc-binding protein, partial [Desulfovibrionaceae bacterium]|nr:zinc-binding protein [Desulfovibrionaceae bacterium]